MSEFLKAHTGAAVIPAAFAIVLLQFIVGPLIDFMFDMILIGFIVLVWKWKNGEGR